MSIPNVLVGFEFKDNVCEVVMHCIAKDKTVSLALNVLETRMLAKTLAVAADTASNTNIINELD